MPESLGGQMGGQKQVRQVADVIKVREVGQVPESLGADASSGLACNEAHWVLDSGR